MSIGVDAPLMRSDSGYDSAEDDLGLPPPYPRYVPFDTPLSRNGWLGRIKGLWTLSFGYDRIALDDEEPNGHWTQAKAAVARGLAGLRNLEGFQFWLFIICTAILPFSVYTAVGDYFEWDDRRHKTPADWAHDLISCIMWCSFAFTARGGSKVKLHWSTVATTLATALIWGTLSELPVFRHSLTDIGKWSVWMWGALAFAMLLVLFGAALHIQYAWNHKRMFSIVYRPLILTTIFVVSAVIISHVQNTIPGAPTTTIHFHHYQFSLLLSLSCILPTWWSRILQGICLGMFVHGQAAYGADNVLDQNWSKPNCESGLWSCKCARVSCSCREPGVLYP